MTVPKMVRRLSAAFVGCALTLGLALGAQAQNIKIGTAPDLAHPLLSDIVAGFGAAHRGKTLRTVAADGAVAFEISTDTDLDAKWTTLAGSSANLFDALLDRDLDVVLTTSSLSPTNIGAFRGRGLGDPQSPDLQQKLGFTPLVAAVSPRTPLRNISELALARVIAGEVTNWSDLGITPAPIKVFLSRQNDMADRLLDRTLGREATIAATTLWFKSDTDLARALASDANAVGLIAARNANGLKRLSLLDACGAPWPQDSFAVKSGVYPYTATLNAIRSGDISKAKTDQLWAFLGSSDIISILNLAGLYDARMERLTLNAMGARWVSAITSMQTEATLSDLRAMLAVLQGAERLSLTFRPTRTGEKLDTQSAAQMTTLVDYLKSIRTHQPEIILAGFTDNLGLGGRNEEKSLRMAMDIAAHLRNALGTDMAISSHGFGEIAPLLCNDHEANRALNRRVEIWVR